MMTPVPPVPATPPVPVDPPTPVVPPDPVTPPVPVDPLTPVVPPDPPAPELLPPLPVVWPAPPSEVPTSVLVEPPHAIACTAAQAKVDNAKRDRTFIARSFAPVGCRTMSRFRATHEITRFLARERPQLPPGHQPVAAAWMRTKPSHDEGLPQRRSEQIYTVWN